MKPWILSALLAGAVAAQAVGATLPVTDNDAATYAASARETLAEGHWFVPVVRGEVYLEKPPLCIWLDEASFALFGAGTVSSKIPSILFSWLAIASAAGLAALWAGRKAGELAAVIAATVLATFLMDADCRSDAVLTGGVALGCWQLCRYLREGRLSALLLGCLGTGCGLLAKGLIGGMIPALVVAGDALAGRRWRALLRPGWLLGVPVVGLLLAPAFVSEYRAAGMEGVLFPWWTISAGKFAASGDMLSGRWETTHDTPLFYAHTLVWVMWPWTPLFLAAVVLPLLRLRQMKLAALLDEVANPLPALLLSLCAIAMVKVRLPHYVFVLGPLVAVMAARVAAGSAEKPLPRWLDISQLVFALAGPVLVAVLAAWALPSGDFLVWGAVVLGLAVPLGAWLRARQEPIRLVVPAAVASIATVFALCKGPFRDLIGYQATLPASQVILEKGHPSDPVALFDLAGNPWGVRTLDFYTARRVFEAQNGVPDIAVLTSAHSPVWVYTTPKGAETLRAAFPRAEVAGTWPDFHVERMTGRFLDPRTRGEVTERRILLRITAAQAGQREEPGSSRRSSR